MNDGRGLLWLLDFLGTVMQGQEGIIKQLQGAQQKIPDDPPPDLGQSEPRDPLDNLR